MRAHRWQAASFTAVAAICLAACSSGSGSPTAAGTSGPAASQSASQSASPTSSPTPTPTPTPSPTPTFAPAQGAPGAWVTAVSHEGRPEIQAQTVSASGSSVVVMRMDAPSTRLILHAGYEDPGAQGWLAGPAISDAEKPKLLAAFNGGFRLGLGLGGFSVLGHTVGTIAPGLASVVQYTDGSSGLGVWGTDVPFGGKQVFSVRQNLGPLIVAGAPAANIDQYGPWGATLGGGFAVARSALGIDRFGNLMWAGSTYATPRAMATALIQSGAIRGMQLDINPMWVDAFTFPTLAAQTVVLPSQYRPVGTYIQPYSRDFFTVTLRPAT
jgi:hypothetical protein